MKLRHHKKKIVAGSIVCAAVLFLTLLPMALRPAIALAIHANGFPQAKIGSIRFLPHGILIENIYLDKDGFSTVENIQITGPWRDLILNHRADKVNVKSVNLSGEINDKNQITIAGWDGKLNTSSDNNPSALPFNSFYLDGMKLDLDTPLGGVRAEAKAVLEKNLAGGQTLTASIWSSQKIFSTNMNFNGTLSSSGKLSGKIDIQDTSVDISPITLSRLSGWVEFQSDPKFFAIGQIMAGGMKYKNMPFEDMNVTLDSSQPVPATLKMKMAGSSVLLSTEWIEQPSRMISATVSADNLGDVAALADVKNDLLSQSGSVSVSADMEISDAFQMADEISVHDSKVKFAGGNLALDPFTWNMKSSKNSVGVNLDGLQLSALAGQDSSLQASGSISGKIPLRLVGKDVFIDKAVLKSDQPGFIKYAPDKMPPALQGDDSRMATVRQALSNYNYETLEITLDGPLNGNLKTSISAKGKSPAFENRPVNLNLNLEGALTSALTQALQPGALSDKLQKQFTEGIK